MAVAKIYIEPSSAASTFISSHMDFQSASIADCDFILSSLTWGTADRDTIQAALDAQRSYSRTTLVFLVTDSCDTFDIPQHVRLFRTSFYRSKKHVNERLLPYVWEGSATGFELLRVSAAKPVVGFCGTMSGNRASLIRDLQADHRVRTNFVIRDKFWGGRPHDPKLVAEFNDNIAGAHFTVCNRGVGNFSMRFYQVLAAGRIPILVHQDMEYPYESEIDWDDYLVRGESDQEVIEKLVEFWRTKDIEKVQADCRKLHEKYFRPDIFCRRVLQDVVAEEKL